MTEWFCIIQAFTQLGKTHPTYPTPIGYIPKGGAPTLKGKMIVKELEVTQPPVQIAYYTKTASGWSYTYSSTPLSFDCCDRPPVSLDIDETLIVDTTT